MVRWCIKDAGTLCVADLETNEPTHYGEQHSDANARLIAAAPELLAALETALEYADNRPPGATKWMSPSKRQPWVEDALAAIAKATGTSEPVGR